MIILKKARSFSKKRNTDRNSTKSTIVLRFISKGKLIEILVLVSLVISGLVSIHCVLGVVTFSTNYTGEWLSTWFIFAMIKWHVGCQWPFWFVKLSTRFTCKQIFFREMMTKTLNYLLIYSIINKDIEWANNYIIYYYIISLEYFTNKTLRGFEGLGPNVYLSLSVKLSYL